MARLTAVNLSDGSAVTVKGYGRRDRLTSCPGRMLSCRKSPREKSSGWKRILWNGVELTLPKGRREMARFLVTMPETRRMG